MKEADFDVAIIGAGVTGAAIARKLAAYSLKVALLEKESDVSFGTSKANSGIIHGCFHHSDNYLKGQLELQGNIMFDELARELDFPFKRIGIIVAAFLPEEMNIIEHLYLRGKKNASIGIEMCSRERILSLEPKLHKDVIGGLYAPVGGLIEPYRFVFSLVESAVKNGVRLFTNFHVNQISCKDHLFTITSQKGDYFTSRYCINAAGLYADEISSMCGAESYIIHPRKGQYYLLDKNTKSCPSHIIFPVPGSVSKGMLVIPTLEGTVLIGPTAEGIDDKNDFATSGEALQKVVESARTLIPTVSQNDVITSFAGLRPALESGDFFIEESKLKPGFIHVAGIQSPGLTAAPAIALYVKDILKKAGCPLSEKKEYDPYVEKIPRIRKIKDEEVDALISENPLYGEIVCRCENISEAEIVHAIRKGHTTLDGIKFFARAGMGRCQGGFCTYKILKIISRETGIPIDEITKRGNESKIVSHLL